MFTALLFTAWIFLIQLLHKAKMHFFKFAAGAVGSFLLLMRMGTGVADRQLEEWVTWSAWLLGRVTGLFNAYPGYSMITVYHGQQALSFLVDYECSGFIEMLVFVCLLLFYPVYGLPGKAKQLITGVFFIFLANVARVLIICVIVKLFGASLFFLSHTVFARLFFFFAMVVLYYRVFTRPHILKQKVGKLSYGS